MSNGIHAYNAKVTEILGADVLGTEPWQNVFYGVELEYEIDADSAFVKGILSPLSSMQQLKMFTPDNHRQTPISYLIANAIQPNLGKFAIIKRDGSLQNGIEIVSRPASLDIHRTNWEKFFEVLPKSGLAITRTCGMHVHASREGLTNLQIGKILAFLHNPANYEFVKIISGRCPPKKYANVSNPLKVADVNRHTERYDGFNLRNTATVEFRIFKGVDTLSRMLANIDFCASMIGFAHPSTTGIRDCTLQNYVNFVSDSKNKKRYPELYKLLKSKKFVS